MRRVRDALILGLLWALPTGGYAQLSIIPQERVQEAANPSTIENSPMHFESEATLSFGTIQEDCGLWSGEIEWRSEGDKTLTITRITSSCGCLEAEWNRREATAATKGSLRVKYHPKGHPGNVEQRLFVYTTLSERRPTAIVRVVGKVLHSEDRRGNYPYTIGKAYLRQKEVVLPRDGGAVRVAIMNGGATPLRLSHDKHLTMGGIEAHTEPRKLPAGHEGDLVITFRPNGQSPRLYLDGIGVAPRERKIEVRIED